MANVLIGLGSNLGFREANLQQALELLGQTPGIDLRAVSRWLPSRPVGGPAGQPDFLNGAALLQTSLSPEHLLHRVQEIEHQLGRVRSERWGPRTLDVDILLYDELVFQSPRLRIPHPAMPWRRFVLEPAAQVAGWMEHPEIGWTVRQLWDHLRMAFPYVAITGPYPALNTRLARRIAHQTGAEPVCMPGWLRVGLRMLGEKGHGAVCPPNQDQVIPPNQGGDAPNLSPSTPGSHRPLEPAPEDAFWAQFAQPTQLAKDILQWLQVLTERLPAHRYRRGLDGWVVSDFWLPGWLEQAAAVLEPLLSEEDRKLWESLTNLIAPAKLLVVLEMEDQTAEDRRLPGGRTSPTPPTSKSNHSRSRGDKTGQIGTKEPGGKRDEYLDRGGQIVPCGGTSQTPRIPSHRQPVDRRDRGRNYPPKGCIDIPQQMGDFAHRHWQGPVLRIQLARGIWPPRLTRAAAEVHIAMQGMD